MPTQALFNGKFPINFGNRKNCSVVVPYAPSMDGLKKDDIVELTNKLTAEKVEVQIIERKELIATAIFDVEILRYATNTWMTELRCLLNTNT